MDNIIKTINNFSLKIQHLISINYVIGSGLKFFALAACIINIATAFNINIPYITDKKKLPKNFIKDYKAINLS